MYYITILLPTLYPSSRSSHCIFFFFFFSPFFVYINKLLKQRPVKITGKNIKSYATAQVHFPWEREGSLTAKSPTLSFKIYYPLLNFTSKLFPNWVLWAKVQRITQIPHNSPTQSANYTKFAVLLTYSILCFRHLPRQRTLRNSSELRKFCAIRPHSQRIMRNSHHLLTLHLRFRCLTSGRELLKIPANQAKFAQFAQLSHELREFRAFRAFRSKLIHI